MRLAAIGDNCVDFYEKQGWAYPGGNAVNVAVYGRQLGMDAAYLGWIGTDNFGDMMQEKLKEQDVETVRMQSKQGKTAITYIELLDGDRKFGEDFLNVLEGFQLSDGDLQYLAGFDCVHMAVWGQCDSCLGKLPQEVKISYDFSNRYGEEKIERLAPYIDYVFFSNISGRTDVEEPVRTQMLFIWQAGGYLQQLCPYLFAICIIRQKCAVWRMCRDVLTCLQNFYVESGLIFV